MAFVAVAAKVSAVIAFLEFKMLPARSHRARCDVIRAGIAELGETRLITEGAELDVVVIGDSYTSGDHLQDKADRWASRLGYSLGWTVRTNSVSRTGYVNGGFCGDQAYTTRADRVAALRPEMVIVQGGLNDALLKKITVAPSADAVLASLAEVPTVVVIGPNSAPHFKGKRIIEIDAALALATAAHGRKYISTLAWDLDYLDDRAHLTSAGHAQFAQLVESSLA